MSRDTDNRGETICLSALILEVLREQAMDPSVVPSRSAPHALPDAGASSIRFPRLATKEGS